MIGRILTIGAAVMMLAASSAAAAPKVVYGPARPVAPKVTARSLSFESGGRKVTGEVISGPGGASHPGILFVHWLGEPKTTNHTEFEGDAVALARRGVASVLIDAMWADPAWFDRVGISDKADLEQAAGQIQDIRRALDVLEAQPGIDPGRIAYVGHDFGAMFGALAAGEDPRPSLLVLMAGVPTMSEWYLLGKTHPHKDDYVRALDGGLDITGALGRVKAKAVLIQFAAHDRYVSAERAAIFAAATPLPRTVATYDTDHGLAVPQAAADRRAWLLEHLLAP